ncbi:MAG: polysaccharide deacetylase family protein [Nitrosopumilus sp.]|nr:polysaccharide deacetylase family protein [Nitrosopumilus sp.]
MQLTIILNCFIVLFIVVFLYSNYSHDGDKNEYISVFAESQKVVILTFDDDWKNHYTYVKPILEKYGFKSSFYITPGCISYQNSSFCNNTATPDSVMTWNDVNSLQNAGHDIQSHGMSHKDLTALSDIELEYEIGQSKKDLFDHGINSTVFGNAFAAGENNSTVIKAISKYYDMARAGYGSFAFLKCDECENNSNYEPWSSSNRYSLAVNPHYGYDSVYENNGSKILSEFIEGIHNQTTYNENGEINAIPILAYHNIDNIDNNIDPNWVDSTTDLDLFDKEMKYLYDNNIKVLMMSDLGYNQSSNQIYIMNFNNNSITK